MRTQLRRRPSAAGRFMQTLSEIQRRVIALVSFDFKCGVADQALSTNAANPGTEFHVASGKTVSVGDFRRTLSPGGSRDRVEIDPPGKLGVVLKVWHIWRLKT